MRKLFKTLLLFGLVMLFFSDVSAQLNFYSGKVINANTKLPVKDVMVSLYIAETFSFSYKTDINGRFYINFDDVTPDSKLVYEKKGYATYEYLRANNDELELNFEVELDGKDLRNAVNRNYKDYGNGANNGLNANNYSNANSNSSGMTVVEGVTYDKTNKRIVKNVVLQVDELLSGTDKRTIKADENGKFVFTIDPSQYYSIVTNYKEYLAARATIQGCELGEKQQLCMSGFSLVQYDESVSPPSKVTVEIEMDPIVENMIINLGEVYYNAGEHEPLPDGLAVLKRAAQIVADNGMNVEFELASHTDSKGDYNYNLDLSNKRANIARDYVYYYQTEDFNLHAKGYGESVLKNECNDEVPCSDDKHAENRRTELRVIKVLQ